MSEDQGKIVCLIDNVPTHIIERHLKDYHPDISIEEYRARFPDAPILSDKAKEAIEKANRKKEERMEREREIELSGKSKVHIAELFGFPDTSYRTKSGDPMCAWKSDLDSMPSDVRIFVPEIDTGYVFESDLLSAVMYCLEESKNLYLWGHMGVGKSTIIEQVAAHTNRGMMRVQHTRNTEESHIIGQFLLKDGQTVFELGPLAYCMKHGLIYLADEYDFAMPAVMSVYQPVLEGKPLIIKDADAENRVIHPHPDFRFFATGNTNGSGDETGLYQGTLVQNAANYERFAVVMQVKYMKPEIEAKIIRAKTSLTGDDVEKMVRFANTTRERYQSGDIALPMSPRSLLNAVQNSIAFGGYAKGIELAYSARLDSVGRGVIEETIKRIFPSKK